MRLWHWTWSTAIEPPRGLTLLELDPALCGAAEHHAADMLARNYFDHRSPEGEDVMDRYAAAGGSRWLGVAENIFKCLACPEPPGEAVIRTMHGQWMQSREHRETILSQTHSRFCFGIAADPQVGYAGVQTFAGPGGPRMGSQGRKPRVLSREALRGFALALINDRRRVEARDALRAQRGFILRRGGLPRVRAEAGLSGARDAEPGTGSDVSERAR